MKKTKLWSLLLSGLLCLGLSGVSAATMPTDLPPEAWYYDAVLQCYSEKLLQGVSPDRFAPDEPMTVKEAVVLAARLHSKYNNKDILPGNDWFAPYLQYCIDNKLLSQDSYYWDTFANREIFAGLLYRVLPHDLPAMNDLDQIPAYPNDSPFFPAVQYLYQRGILGGTDVYGRFSPYKILTRAEVAVLCQRVLQPDTRLKFAPQPLPTDHITKLPIDGTQMELEDFDGNYFYCRNEKLGASVFTLDGTQLLPWAQSYELSDGVFWASMPDEMIHFYDTTGTFLFSTPDNRLTQFENGYAVVLSEQFGTPYSLIDKQGNVFAHFTEEDIGGGFEFIPFYRTGDYGIVYVSPTHIGILEFPTGKLTVFPHPILFYGRIRNGYFPVRYYDEAGIVQENFSDLTGKLLLKTQYARIFVPFYKDLFLAGMDEEHLGVASLSQEGWIVPPEYDSVNVGGTVLFLEKTDDREQIVESTICSMADQKLQAIVTVTPGQPLRQIPIGDSDYLFKPAPESDPFGPKALFDLYGNLIIPAYENDLYFNGQQFVYKTNGAYYLYDGQ